MGRADDDDYDFVFASQKVEETFYAPKAMQIFQNFSKAISTILL